MKGEKISIDETDNSITPILEKGRILVPLRFIGESLDAIVGWDGPTQTVSVKTSDSHVLLVVGEHHITINGVKRKLDVPAKIKNARTLLPLRAVSEALGKHVHYQNGLISIGAKPKQYSDQEVLAYQEQLAMKVYIPIETVMQHPELPNGCEITSLTAVLHYYGYTISKTDMSDHYLPKEPFSWKEGKRFGPNPYKAYSGDPRSKTGGWFSYAPPIQVAVEKYVDEIQGVHTAIDVTGSTREEIIHQLDQGVPVVIWVTLDLSKPKIKSHWYFHDTEEYFAAPTNLHAVVLHGYEGDMLHVMDPLQGQVTHPVDRFFESYKALGSHAMVVVNHN
jgi:uncharacterized protein YvpB